MKSLYPEATEILVRFIDRLQGAREITLPLDGNFPIRITQGEPVKTTEGEGCLFGIGLMYDTQKPAFQPLLKLIVIHKRVAKDKIAKVSAFPTFFSDDLDGIVEWSCTIRNGTIQHCIPRIQKSHARFIHRWLLQLVAMGYLNTNQSLT